MGLVTLDVVLVLPTELRATTIGVSSALAELMDQTGSGAAFRLGEPFPGRDGGVCEPHVSVFMMAVEEAEIACVVDSLARLAPRVDLVDAIGSEYRYNGEGAPEAFFERSAQWRRLQRAVITDVEPLRRGRLREFGPGGEPLADIVAEPDPADAARVRQLQRYGYDAISDDTDDRFDPHVTLAWPKDEDFRVDLSGLPPINVFDCVLTDLALYEMSPNGTCTRDLGHWALGRPQ